MKEKTFQTRCGTIHYWASVSNPDIRRAVALENLISDGRQPDIAEIQTRIRVTVDDNAFSVTAGGLSSRTVHRLFLPRHPPCSGGVQGDLFQYRVKSVAHGIAVGDAFQHSEVIFPVAECRSFTPELADKLAALYDKYDGFGNLRSLQVTGIATMVEPFSEEYNTHAAFKKIPLDALKKLPSPMNLICVTPTRIDALFSDFKKDGYSVRQVLHQLA